MHQLRRSWHPSMRNLGETCIRPARAEDETSILRCLSSAFEPFRCDYTADAFADTVLDQVSLRERMKSMQVLVASASGTIVGTVAAGVHGTEGHLRGMAIVPEWQRAGIASKLLAAV